MEDLIDFLYSLYGIGGRSVMVGVNIQKLVNRASKPGYNGKEDNVSETEYIEDWDPEVREKVRDALDAGGAAILSVYHKGFRQKSKGSHILTIQAVTSTGLTVDCPYGAINPDYRFKDGTIADMYIDTGKGDVANTRSSYDWKNVPDYDKSETDYTKRDFTVTAGQNLKDNESRGKNTEISYKMINESHEDFVRYIQILHRPE